MHFIGTMGGLFLSAFVFATVFSMSGCSSREQDGDTAREGPADPADPYAWSIPWGPGTITGEAFRRQRGGDIVTCAGEDVFAIPSGPLTSQFVLDLTMGWDGDTADSVMAYSRRWKCNRNGEFSFVGLPFGEWILLTSVEWRAGRESQGGWVSGVAEITADGPNHEIIMTSSANTAHSRRIQE